jgi:hypothetical protein
MKKVIICAGGDGLGPNQRWKETLGVTKHMIPAYGVPLIHRLQNQLLDVGFTDIHVACSVNNKESYIINGSNFIESPECVGNIREISCIWHYRDFLNYDGITVLLFGDTFYTDEIISAIFKDNGDPMHFYGRFNSSKLTNNNRQGEKFAYVFHNKFISQYIDSLENSVPKAEKFAKTSLGVDADLTNYTYDKFCNIQPEYDLPWLYMRRKEDIHWVEWDDLTDDFDFPDDWENKSKLYPTIFYNENIKPKHRPTLHEFLNRNF